MKSAEDIFQKARAIKDHDARLAYLDEACSGQTELRQRVEALLSLATEADEWFEAGHSLYSDTLEDVAQDAVGDSIGRYRLLQKIGEGGMGVVYMAEQREPVVRKVALKIIKLGMDTKNVVARFEAERQALAIMDHPNIAKVFDAGSIESTNTKGHLEQLGGRPYFVMELVQGLPITQFCDEAKLSPERRLELFVDVCSAIQHAHQKGVIHRDIKPNNILVTLHGDKPVPKVIDFGIAKATQQRLTEKTLFTQFQHFIGTPAYMSPEQASLSGLDIDTRSDVYSLGVLLYELLTGTTPFDGKQLLEAGLDEMRRTIREQDPPKPSTRVSTMEGSERINLAERRGTDANGWSLILRGDLDWIVMKAIDKDRTRRYETANGLAMDIRRMMGNEPVTARPPSAAYKLQKAWQRNKTFYTSAAAIFVALLTGLSVSLWQASQASQARDAEFKQRKEAEKARTDAQASANLANVLKREAEANEIKALNMAEEMRLRSYVSDMKVVQYAIMEDNRMMALEILNRHRPRPGQKDLRDVAWRYLWSQSRSDELKSFKPSDQINAFVTYSPSGRWIATGDLEGQLQIWDAESLRLVKDLPGMIPGAYKNIVDFSPDEAHLAMIQKGALVLLRTEDWEVEHHFGKVKTPLTHIKFSKDGYFLSARYGHDIRVFDLINGTDWILHLKIEWDKYAPTFCWDFLFDNQHIVVGSRSGHFIRIIRVKDGATIAQLNDSGADSLVVSSSGQHIIANCPGGYLRTWDTSTFELLSEFKRKGEGSVYGLATSADGTILASASTDQLIRTYSLPDLKQIGSYRGHSSEAWHVSFHPKENTLVSAGKESAIRFWDMNSLNESPDKVNAFENVTLEDFVAGRQRLGSASEGGKTHFWRIKGQTPILDYTLPVSPSHYMQMCFSEEGLSAAIPGKGKIDFLDCHSGTILKTVSLSEGGCDSLSFSPDRQWLTGRRYQKGGSLRWALIHVDTANETATFLCPKNYAAGYKNAFSPDSKHFAYAAADFSFRIWDLQEQREVHKLEGHTWYPYSCNFSHDGKLLVTSCWDGEARIWDVETGQLHVPPLRGHVRGVNRTEFSPDDRTLLTSGDDGTTRIWSVATGQEMVSIPDQSRAMFADDGNTLVLRCCNDSKGVTCIPLPTLKEIDRMEAVRSESTKRSL